MRHYCMVLCNTILLHEALIIAFEKQILVFKLRNFVYLKLLPPSPLWRCDLTRAKASSFLRFLDHTQ